MRKRIAAGAFLLFLPCLGWSLTLSDVRDQVRRNVGDNSTTPAYSDTILNDLVNEGQRSVINATWALQEREAITLVSGTTYYSLNTNLIAPSAALFTNSSGATVKLEATSEWKVFEGNPDYERQSGSGPSEYFIRQSTSGAADLEIAFIPVSNSAAGTVTLIYASQGDDLSDDDDVPFNALSYLYPYHETLVFYVTARIKLMEFRADESAIYFKLYDSRVKEMSEKLNNLPDFQINFRGASGVGR